MRESFDVVVAGAGPAGSSVARWAAAGGLDVLVVDKKSELGTPQQCSGAVSANALAECDVAVDDAFVAEPVHGFRTLAADGEVSVLDYRAYGRDEPLGYVVDRKRFDRHLAARAVEAGAELQLRTAVGSFEVGRGEVRVTLEQWGRPRQVRARVLVGADGLMSQIGLRAGLAVAIPLADLASCLQYVVEGVPTSGLLEILCSHTDAPGGYAWVFPRGAGMAEVGLGVTRTCTTEDARTHLDRFLASSFDGGRLRDARVVEVQGGGVPLAAALRRMVADHVLLVGDAARQVNPITGGGIHTALRAGRIAGEFLAETMPGAGSLDAAVLAGYQQRWDEQFGTLHAELYQIKKGVFAEPDLAVRDRRLFETMSSYFSPTSRYRKI